MSEPRRFYAYHSPEHNLLLMQKGIIGVRTDPEGESYSVLQSDPSRLGVVVPLSAQAINKENIFKLLEVEAPGQLTLFEVYEQPIETSLPGAKMLEWPGKSAAMDELVGFSTIHGKTLYLAKIGPIRRHPFIGETTWKESLIGTPFPDTRKLVVVEKRVLCVQRVGVRVEEQETHAEILQTLGNRDTVPVPEGGLVPLHDMDFDEWKVVELEESTVAEEA